MSNHYEFFRFLGGIDGGELLRGAYRAYKLADGGSAFVLNDELKRGSALNEELGQLSENLEKVICAENTEPIVLYRMTSDVEFGRLTEAQSGEPFTYPAFMSTSGRDNNLSAFVPGRGRALLVEIHCPPGTRMALLEEDGGMEDEYLLGHGTLFRGIGFSEVRDQDSLAKYLGVGSDQKMLLWLKLEVIQNPPYTSALVSFPFEKDDFADEVEYV